MSQKHPVIAITGSSGAGTSTVKNSFEHIFRRANLTAAVVEGDSFHRYDRAAMKQAVAESEKDGARAISHFGPEANEFDKLATLFKEYGESGSGQTRLYLHNDEEAQPWNQQAGTFTPWSSIASGTDLLFYEGLHGGAKSDTADIAKYVDLLVGVVPIVNLEWIQKIFRDTSARGYSSEAVTHTILRRMHDYVHYITPQFSRSHINFQRVPTVDTSNPFISRDIPTLDESMVVIRFRDPENIDFTGLLALIHDSFMSRPNTIVVPGGKMGMAIELILTPLIDDIIAKSKQ